MSEPEACSSGPWPPESGVRPEGAPQPDRHRLVQGTLLVIVILLALEIGVRFLTGWSLALRRVVAAAGTLEDGQGISLRSRHSRHPYLGFVEGSDPWEESPIGSRPRLSPSCNGLGFRGPLPPVRPDPESFWIGLAGGSVGRQLYSRGREVLEERLAGDPALNGRRPRCVSIAGGGHHQPQQALTLAYLATLGVQLDAVVNLDGFNEVALIPAQNWRQKVSPAFPTKWANYFKEGLDPEEIAALSRVQRHREDEAWWAWLAARRPLCWSTLARSLVGLRIMSLRRGRSEAEQALALTLADRGEFPAREVAGPGDTRGGRKRSIEASVAIWARSAVLSAHLARRLGARDLRGRGAHGV